MDDASIMELLRQRDERAIAELRLKYERLCTHIAGNVLSRREDIEECVSSALFEVWSRIPPASPDDLRSYLCRIVRNIAINKLEYISAAKRDSRYDVSLDEIADCVPSAPDEEISLSELADAISHFLRTQDDVQRRVFVRRYTFGDSLADIAARYGLN